MVMAEESIESPATPKRSEAGRGRHERRSETPPTPKKTVLIGRGHERRSSTGMLDSPRSISGSVNVLSRYLTTSPGNSCHDLCKYGAKHGSIDQPKPRASFPKMVTSSKENAVTSSDQRKKKLAISPSNPVFIKEEISSSKTEETASFDVSVKNGSDDQKLKPVQSKPFSHPADQGSLSTIQRNNEIRISKIKGKELRTSKIGEKKAWVPPNVYLFPKHSTKTRVSSTKTKNENNVKKIEPKQPSNDVVPEKTLYVIEASSTESKTTEDKSLKHARKGIHSSSEKINSLRRTGSGFTAPSPFSSLPINGKKISRRTLPHSKENGEQIANAEMEYKSRPRMGGKVSLEFKASPSRKVKFKREKVVELQSVQVTKRRSSGRKEIGDQMIKSEKVVLKHQNVEGKQRDKQSLYNNVIEETASKLVLSRKSKVKALVDAFETVISLQDTRPSPTTIAC